MTPEQVRTFGFDSLYQLAGSVDRTEKPAQEAQNVLASMSTEQRDLALRTAARRLAFQLLYQFDAAVTPLAPESLADHITKTLLQVDGLGPMALDEARSLTVGAYVARRQADDEFLALAPEWPTNRLAAVDRAILRLAHFEMVSGKTPSRIAVNEAVELAKHYSTDKSPAFINGLLDKVLKRLEPGLAEAPPTTV